MNTVEKLEQEAAKAGANIDYISFKSPKIKGLYCDGSIAISNDLNTSAEVISVLGEELGHHLTSSGIIIDMESAENRKQELRARLWAYDRLIGLTGLIRAYEHGCQGHIEVAEFLEVTEDFLDDAVRRYESKYGEFINIDNYLIKFTPFLGIVKIF